MLIALGVSREREKPLSISCDSERCGKWSYLYSLIPFLDDMLTLDTKEWTFNVADSSHRFTIPSCLLATCVPPWWQMQRQLSQVSMQSLLCL